MIAKDYQTPRHAGSFSGLYQFFKSNNYNLKEVEESISKVPAYTLHKKIQKPNKYYKTMSNGIDHIWQADLVDVSNIAKENKNIKFILTCIDIFSKYAWAVPLKDKSAIEVANGFKKILKQRQPQKIQTDNGKEFFNRVFKELLKSKNIKIYSSLSIHKASIVERFNRTLREKLWRYFTSTEKNKFIDKLDEFLISYNNTFHYTIKMKPIEVNKDNESIV